MRICYSTKRIIGDLIKNLENYGDDQDLLKEMRDRLIQKEEEFYLMFTQDNQGVEVILKRLNYEMETHPESKIINTLLEAMCLLIDMSPREIKKNIEKNEDGTKIISRLAKELCKGTYEKVRINYAATFLTFNISEKCADEIEVPKLIGLVMKEEYKEVPVRMAILGLLNELLLNASEEKRFEYAQVIVEARLPKTLGNLEIKDVHGNRNLQRELYYIQHWSIYHHKKNMNTLVDSRNKDQVMKMIKELRSVAFDKGTFFSKVKFSIVISTSFEFSRQKHVAKIRENRMFQRTPNPK